MIDEGIHLGHLKWMMEEFCKAFFEVDKVELRARPSFFPFTEPSRGMGHALRPLACPARSSSARAMTGWSWAAPAWSIRACWRIAASIPTRYQGFAFGGGIDRWPC